jgi:hypothetical protein
VVEKVTLWFLLWNLLFPAQQAPQAAEPAQFHHFHLNSVDPAANMEYFSRTHGSIKVLLQGLGVGVKVDKSYTLFERVDDDIAPRPWPGPAWNCKEPDRCFEDARSRLELYPPANDVVARLQVLSNDPAAAAPWFEKHLGVKPGEGKMPILFVPHSGPLEQGALLDHVAFSYPNLAEALTRLQAEGVSVIAHLPRSAIVAGPEGLRVEIVEDNEIGANAYWCPMDPKVRASKPGKCPICGMTLVPLDPGEYVEYPVEMKTVPSPVRAGHPAKLIFSIDQPHRDVMVKSYETVHERQFHLFVVSHDMTFFEHIHPEQQKDGTWVVETTLPKPGPYQAFADFFPSGGTPQVVQKTFVTAGFTGGVLAGRAHLVPDAEPVKTVDGTRVRLDSTGYVAGFKQTLTFSLTDEKTGLPVNDLEPWLGAGAHMLILSEDLGDYVHGHATLQPGTGQSQLVIETLFPRASKYRIWIQFQRSGKVITAFFTVETTRLK